MMRICVFLVTWVCSATMMPGISSGDLEFYWPFDTAYTDTVGSAGGSPVVAAGSDVSLSAVPVEHACGSGGLRLDSNAGGMAYIDITQSCIPAGRKQVSVSAWYRYEDIGADGSDSRRYVWSTHPSYSCEFSIGSGNDAEWWFLTTGGGVNDTTGPAVTDGLWHHVVTLWDRDANRARFYHDGTLINDTDTSAVSGDLVDSTGFHIGDYRDGNGGRNFDGYIDDVAVFNHALTSDEVLNLFYGASPANIGTPRVRAAQCVSVGGSAFDVNNGSIGFAVNFQNLNAGDHELYAGGSRMLQANGVIIASANDGDDSIVQVGGDLTYTGAADSRYDNGMAFSTADLSGNGEKDISFAFAHFPFSWEGGGWIAAHVAADGSVLAGPKLPAGSTVTKLSTVPAWRGQGQYAVHIAGVDSRLNGMLFVVGGENDNNCTAAGVFEHADDVNIVAGDAALGDWHVHIRDASQNDTSDAGEDGSFSFLYLPYNAVNLIGGRVMGDGTVLRGTGGFAASDGDAPGQVDIAIPDGHGGNLSDQDGILILTSSQILDGLNSGNNQDPVEGNVLSWTYDATDDEFVVHGFDAPTGVAQDTGFVFAFVPFENSLQPPPPTQGTVFLIR